MPTISIDIETYGAVKNHPRHTVFHPRKSMMIQGIPRDALVQTVAVTDAGEGDPRDLGDVASLVPGATRVFVMSRPRHRKWLEGWIRRSRTLVGMNLGFDIQYLRAFSTTFRDALAYRSKKLVDVSCLNFMDWESRPEKSLKDLGPVTAGYCYDAETSLRAGHQFESDEDPALHAYNGEDTHNSLLAAAWLARNIIRRFGPGSPKASSWPVDFYSSTIWACVQMAEAGIPYSVSRLDRLKRRLLRACEIAEKLCRTRGVVLQGEGSGKQKDELAADLAQVVMPLLVGEEKVSLSKTKKIVSWSDANRELFLRRLPPDHPLRPVIEWADSFAKSQKLLSTYAWPLLHGKRKDPTDVRCVLVPVPGAPPGFDVRLAHPSWFPTPSPFKDGEGSEGGTIQVRVTCKDHAAQTDPPRIQRCRRSRFGPAGRICSMDLSQIELRVPAVLSGEPTLIDNFVRKGDLHAARAVRMFGKAHPELLTAPQWKGKHKIFRDTGKTVNFADGYWAGPRRMQQSVAEMTGVVLPLEFFEEAVQDRPNVRPVLYRWQLDLIESVRRDPTVVLPISGHSRTFMGSPELHVNEILNFPIQTTAAITTSCILDELLRRLPASTPTGPAPWCYAYMQVYDSIEFDCRTSHLPRLKSVIRESVDAVTSPTGYWGMIQAHYGHECPLDYDFK